MVKANIFFDVSDLKDAIRAVNKNPKRKGQPKIKLTGSKKELQDRLKAIGRWNELPPKKKVSVKERVKQIEAKTPKKTNIIDELDVESLRTGLRRWGRAKKVSMRGISAGSYDGLIKTIKKLRETGSAKGVKLTNEDISLYFKKEKRKPGKGEKWMWIEGKKVIAPIMT